MQPLVELTSNEHPSGSLPAELLRVTKKVKNKDSIRTDGDDLVMLESEPNKPSFKEMLLGNSSTSPREDVCLPLDKVDEVVLLDNDASISMDGPYPQV